MGVLVGAGCNGPTKALPQFAPADAARHANLSKMKRYFVGQLQPDPVPVPEAVEQCLAFSGGGIVRIGVENGLGIWADHFKNHR